MKIAIFEVEARETAEFESLRRDHELLLTREPLTADNVAGFAGFDIVSTFIYSRLDKNILAQLPSLKLIATRSTGYDHIDVDYCASHGIALCNVPTYGENTVAEHVFALLLAISHRLRDAMERARSGRFSPEGLEGFDLQGKTLGVIGTGNIGRHVIRIAQGFGMPVVAFDIRPDAPAAEELGFRYASFDELLSSSHIITIHVPASPSTAGLLDAAAFGRMKDGVIIINTARGAVIDARALVQALRAGKVGAAGLDVLPDEPLIREEAELIASTFADKHDLRNLVADHVLLRMPNVVVTPHSAFNTREAVHRIVEMPVHNIKAFLDGRPDNLVETGTAGKARPV